VDLLGRLEAAVFVAPVALCHVRHALLADSVTERLQMKRNRDPLADRLVPRLATHLFDDRSDEDVTRIVVCPCVAGLRWRRQILEDVDELRGRVRLVDVGFGHPTGDVGVGLDSACVVQELADGRAAAGLRVIGNELGQRLVERELPFLHQLKKRGCSELLGDRPDPKDGGRRNGRFRLKVGETASPFVHRLPALGDNDGRSRAVGWPRFGDDLVSLLRESGRHGDRRNGRGGENGAERRKGS